MEQELEWHLSSRPLWSFVLSMGVSVYMWGRVGWHGGLIFAILEVGWLQENVHPGFQEISLLADTGTRAGRDKHPQSRWPFQP